MKIVRGDLLALALAGQFDVIVQGCNCQCRMGRGIAASIREQFPEAYAADLATVKGDRSKLGTFSSAVITRDPVSFRVVNACTQDHWTGEGVLADYAANLPSHPGKEARNVSLTEVVPAEYIVFPS